MNRSNLGRKVYSSYNSLSEFISEESQGRNSSRTRARDHIGMLLPGLLSLLPQPAQAHRLRGATTHSDHLQLPQWPSVTALQGELIPSSGLCKNFMHVIHGHTAKENSHTHKINLKKEEYNCIPV